MTRRMTLLVLAIVGLMVLVVTVTPPNRATRDDAAPSPAPAATADDPDEFDVTATLSADSDVEPQTIDAVLGDDVEIIVEGTGPGSVSLGDVQTHLYEEGLPARFTLLAEMQGAYPLVLLDDEGRRIGTLQIK